MNTPTPKVKNLEKPHKKWNIQKYLAEADRLYKFKKIRFTSLRSKILEIILTHKNPIKPYEILGELKKPEYKKNTTPSNVYRSLEHLASTGIIHRLNSTTAYTYCRHPDRHKECFFLICLSCHQVKECCHPRISKAVKQICREQNYQTALVTLEIEGYCSDCQKRLPH